MREELDEEIPGCIRRLVLDDLRRDIAPSYENRTPRRQEASLENGGIGKRHSASLKNNRIPGE